MVPRAQRRIRASASVAPGLGRTPLHAGRAPPLSYNRAMIPRHVWQVAAVLAAIAVPVTAGARQAEGPRGIAQQVLALTREVEEVDRTGRTVTIRTGNTIQ